MVLYMLSIQSESDSSNSGTSGSSSLLVCSEGYEGRKWLTSDKLILEATLHLGGQSITNQVLLLTAESTIQRSHIDRDGKTAIARS
jgi:hypothetical protein